MEETKEETRAVGPHTTRSHGVSFESLVARRMNNTFAICLALIYAPIVDYLHSISTVQRMHVTNCALGTTKKYGCSA